MISTNSMGGLLLYSSSCSFVVGNVNKGRKEKNTNKWFIQGARKLIFVSSYGSRRFFLDKKAEAPIFTGRGTVMIGT